MAKVEGEYGPLGHHLEGLQSGCGDGQGGELHLCGHRDGGNRDPHHMLLQRSLSMSHLNPGQSSSLHLVIPVSIWIQGNLLKLCTLVGVENCGADDGDECGGGQVGVAGGGGDGGKDQG